MRARVIAAAVLFAPSLAAAGPPTEAEVRATATAMSGAITTASAKAMAATFAPEVTIDWFAFADADCDRTFGKYKRAVVAGDRQAKLAACLTGAHWKVTGAPQAAAGTATFELDGMYRVTLTMVAGTAGAARIAALTRVPFEADGETVDGDTDSPPPPPPPPPRPPAKLGPVATAANAVRAAIATGDAPALAAEFATKVTVAGFEFLDAGCDKAFGRYKRKVVARKLLPKLARCVLDAKWSWAQVAAVAGDVAVFEIIGTAELSLRFRTRAGAARLDALTWTDYGVEGNENGDADGEPDTRSGVIGGPPAPPPPPPPPPPPGPPPPQNVAPRTLEALRTGGSTTILPAAATRAEIERSGKTRIVGSFKVCVDVAGKVATVTQLKSSGFAAYDKKLAAGINAWTFRPFEVSNKPVPVCTSSAFLYNADDQTAILYGIK